MPTESSSDMLGFSRVERRLLVAAFDGGRLTSDAGALLLGAADRAIGLIDRFAACFEDGRAPGQVIHVRSYAVIAVYSAVLMNRISPPRVSKYRRKKPLACLGHGLDQSDQP